MGERGCFCLINLSLRAMECVTVMKTDLGDPLNKNLGWPQSPSGSFGEKINSLSLQGF
jgi:hypothetical protein